MEHVYSNYSSIGTYNLSCPSISNKVTKTHPVAQKNHSKQKQSHFHEWVAIFLNRHPTGAIVKE